MTLSPIALFVYNRPFHFKKAISSIKQCNLSDKSDLYIFSDGPKIGDDFYTNEIHDVRKIIREVDGFKNITIIEQENNIGLANSVINGIDLIIRKYGKVIVLEDDLIVSKSFLTYMNSALNKYANDQKVMHISGYLWPISVTIQDTFFLPNISSWGWATWNRAWKNFNCDAEYLLKQIVYQSSQVRFNLDDSRAFYEMLKSQIRGNTDSWAIRWYASIFLLHGLSLFPRQSLVQNLGMDGSGTHCTATRNYDTDLFAGSLALCSDIEENKIVKEQLITYFRELNSRKQLNRKSLSMRERIIDSLNNIFVRINNRS